MPAEASQLGSLRQAGTATKFAVASEGLLIYLAAEEVASLRKISRRLRIFVVG